MQRSQYGCNCASNRLLCCSFVQSDSDSLLCYSFVQSACKIFKAAEECRLDRDEEKAYVLYMKYLTVYDLIKKRTDFKQQQVWHLFFQQKDCCRIRGCDDFQVNEMFISPCKIRHKQDSVL